MYLKVLFRSERRMEREIERQIGAASAVMQSVYWTVVVRKPCREALDFYFFSQRILRSPMVRNFR